MTSSVSRRRLVVRVGFAAVLGAVATACARYGSGDTPAPAPTGAGPGPAPAPAPVSGGAPGAPVIAAAEVPVGGGIVVENQQVVVTQPTAGTFAAFGTTCPHQGCTVNEVAGGTINCPCHGSRFRVADGSVAKGPAKRGLDKRRAAVADGTVHVA